MAKKFYFPEIPMSWIILLLLIGLIFLRYWNIDSWTTAAISTIIGWLTGVKMEQIRKKKK